MKVKYSALISDMRGKLNGSVASKNRYGQYFRNKITPSNPQTITQVEQRARLAQFSRQWRTLTVAQRSAWNGAVSGWTRTNIFGDVVTPSGNILFNRLNLNIATAGGSSILLPPSPSDVATPESLSLAVSSVTPSFDMTFAPTPVPADFTLVVEATPQLSAGIENANNKFRILSTVASAGASPVDLLADYTARFGTLQQGMKVFVRISFINKISGQKSQAIKESAIIL